MSKTIVTKDGFEKMKQRLAEKMKQLKTLRDEKAHAYSVSGDGWHDNPGWIQLGQQEELLAGEVSLLQQKINTALLIDPKKMDKSKVGLGCTVEFMLYKPGALKRLHRLTLVGSGESDTKNHKIAFDSPLGKALNTMSLDEEKTVVLPGGIVQIKINGITYE